MGLEVSGNFFSVYGVRPLLGRPLLPADTEPIHNQVVVLSYELWQRDFGGDPGIIGRTIRLTQDQGNVPNPVTGSYEVVGVMPRHAQFPVQGDLWLPLERRNLFAQQVLVVARLRDGVALDQTNAELSTLASGFVGVRPRRNFSLSVSNLDSGVSRSYETSLLILLGAVSFLLVLSCISVGSLQIARGWARQREIAVRKTLGATTRRLIRQLLTESFLLSLAGGALGLFFAVGGMSILCALAPPDIPRLDEVGLNWTVLAYTLCISLTAAILFGFAPAMQLSRSELGTALKESGAGPFARLSSHHPLRLRNFLIVAEIALAFLLVAGSTLTIRSFEKLTHVDMGYRVKHLLTMWIVFSPSTHANPAILNAAIRDVLDRARGLPGVEDAAIGAWRPLSSGFIADVLIAGESPSASTSRLPAQFQPATPGYFHTMGISLLAGRAFTDSDTVNSKRVAIVNEAMAHRDFLDRPIGKRFSLHEDKNGQPIWLEVVGEVGNTRDDDPAIKPAPEFYLPFSQAQEVGETTLLVRTESNVNPLAVVPGLREQIQAVDKLAPVEGMETMDQITSDSVADPRFRTVLLSIFAALGLILTIVAVYGVISFAVSQRAHEIAVRMALGAHPSDVLRMVLGEGLLLAILGVVVGICGALALTRFLVSLLFEIKPTDPTTFVGVAVLLALVALIACWIPARRAMKVDPMVALRYE